jgi:hypothetical protein
MGNKARIQDLRVSVPWFVSMPWLVIGQDDSKKRMATV